MRIKKSGKWKSFSDLPKNYETMWFREKDNKNVMFKLDLKDMTLSEINTEIIRLAETTEYLKNESKLNNDASWHELSYD